MNTKQISSFKNQGPSVSWYWHFFLIFLILLSMTGHMVLFLLKPLPIILMIIKAAMDRFDAEQQGYVTLIIAGLGWSMVGDILLMFDQNSFFIAGMIAFMAAHVCYIGAFRYYYKWKPYHLFILALFAFYGIIFLIWMAPHLGNMLIPIAVYSGFILTMGFFALTIPRYLAGVGAILFIVSDSLIVLNKFAPFDVKTGIWVMSTYYLAQFCFVLSIEKKSI